MVPTSPSAQPIGDGTNKRRRKIPIGVFISYRRDEEAAKRTEEEIRRFGRRGARYRASVDRPEEVEALTEALLRDFGAVDILVHNAGIASRGHSVVDTDPAELERVVRVHALGPHHLSQKLLPAMRTRPRGDIVMISSVATLFHAPGGAPYSMGKAAMEALAFTLAKEERPHGIHVNVVAPGLVETEMGRRLVRATRGIEDLRSLDAAMPFGHVCKPEEVASVVRFLVSDAAGYVTGEKINVHGGGG